MNKNEKTIENREDKIEIIVSVGKDIKISKILSNKIKEILYKEGILEYILKIKKERNKNNFNSSKIIKNKYLIDEKALGSISVYDLIENIRKYDDKSDIIILTEKKNIKQNDVNIKKYINCGANKIKDRNSDINKLIISILKDSHLQNEYNKELETSLENIIKIHKTKSEIKQEKNIIKKIIKFFKISVNNKKKEKNKKKNNVKKKETTNDEIDYRCKNCIYYLKNKDIMLSKTNKRKKDNLKEIKKIKKEVA